MRISRRAFGSLIAASALARAASAEPAAPAQIQPNAEVEARINWVFTKHGSRLNDEQRADVRRIVSGGQPAIDAMRAFPLGNEVGPPVPFRVYSGKRIRPRAKLEEK
ncbi:MAG TPA: hypothetical protein VGJ81_06135 [Thermoanaerobaculia bacterium]